MELLVGYNGSVCMGIYSKSTRCAATYAPGGTPGARQASRMDLRGPSRGKENPSWRDLHDGHEANNGGELRLRQGLETRDSYRAKAPLHLQNVMPECFL